MSTGMLVAVAGGPDWTEFPGGERRARRILSRLQVPTLSQRANPVWTPAVTHLIVPTPVRSVLWLCAVASCKTAILRPDYLEACDRVGAILPSESFQWDCDLDGEHDWNQVFEIDRQAVSHELTGPESQTRPGISEVGSRLWLGAASFWHKYGPPFRGHTVLLVGEMRPSRARGQGVPSTDSIALILKAAGAATVMSVRDSPERPTFAIVPCDADVTSHIVQECIKGEILCLGAAFVLDFISKASADMSEYLAFQEQRDLISDPITRSAIVSMMSREMLPVSRKQSAQPENELAPRTCPEQGRSSAETWQQVAGCSPNPSKAQHRLFSAHFILEMVDELIHVASTARSLCPSRGHRQVDSPVACDTISGSRRKRFYAENSAAVAKKLRRDSLSSEFAEEDCVGKSRSNDKSSLVNSACPVLRCQTVVVDGDDEQSSTKSNGRSCMPGYVHDICGSQPDGECQLNRAEFENFHAQKLSDSNTAESSTSRKQPRSQRPRVQKRHRHFKESHDKSEELPTFRHQEGGTISSSSKRRPPIIRETPESDADDTAESARKCATSFAGSASRGGGINEPAGQDNFIDSDSSDEDDELLKPLSRRNSRAVADIEGLGRPTASSQAVKPANYGKYIASTSDERMLHESQRQIVSSDLLIQSIPKPRKQASRTASDDSESKSECSESMWNLSNNERSRTLCSDEDTCGGYSAARKASECSVSSNPCMEGDRNPDVDKCYAYVLSLVKKFPSSQTADCLRKPERENQGTRNSAYRHPAQDLSFSEDESGIQCERNDLLGPPPAQFSGRQRGNDAVAYGTHRHNDEANQWPPSKDRTQTTSQIGTTRDDARQKKSYAPPTSTIFIPFPHQDSHTMPEVVGSLKIGHEEDDAHCETDVNALFWVLNADNCLGLVGFQSKLVNNSYYSSLVRDCCKCFLESKVLYRLQGGMSTSSDISCVMGTKLVSFFARFLSLRPGKEYLSSIFEELFMVLELQRRQDGDDAISAVLNASSLPLICQRQQVLFTLWLMLCRYCESESAEADFWAMYNNILPVFQGRFLSDNWNPAVCREANEQTTLSMNGHQAIEWAYWVLNSVTRLGSLYCVSFHGDEDPKNIADGIDTVSNGRTLGKPANCPPNWAAVLDAIMTVLSRVSCGVNGRIAGSIGANETHPDNNGTNFLKRIDELMRDVVLDLACGFWLPSEEFVARLIEALQRFYVSNRLPCSCTGLPRFLLSLQNPGHLKHRRPALETFVATSCDCVMLLSWILVNGSQRPCNRIAGRLVRSGSNFAKASIGFQEPYQGVMHGLALTLCVADAITSVSNENGESLLMGLMFSKLPGLNVSANASQAFVAANSSVWQTAVEALVLRCRVLNRSKSCFSVYMDFLADALYQSFRCLEQEACQNADTLASKEGLRMQRGLILDIAQRIMEALATLVDLHQSSSWMAADVYTDDSIRIAKLDPVLSSLTRIVSMTGVVLQGIFSRQGSSNISFSRNQQISFVENALALLNRVVLFAWRYQVASTANSNSRLRDYVEEFDAIAPCNASDFFLALVKSLREAALNPFTSFLRFMHEPTKLEDHRNLKEASAASIARVLKLSFLLEMTGKPLQDASNSSQTLIYEVMHQAGFSLAGGLQKAAVVPSQKFAVADFDDISNMPAASVEGRALIIVFYSTLCESSCTAPLLDVVPALEVYILATWAVLLCSREAVETPEPILKFAWTLMEVSDSRQMLGTYFANCPLDSLRTELAANRANFSFERRVQAISEVLHVLSETDTMNAVDICALCDVIGYVMTVSLKDCARELVSSSHAAQAGTTTEVSHSLFALEVSCLGFALRASLRLHVPDGASNFSSRDVHNIRRSSLASHHQSAFNSRRWKREILEGAKRSFDFMECACIRLSEAVKMCSGEIQSSSARLARSVMGNVIYGVSCLGYDHRNVELRLRFLRIARYLSNISAESLLYPAHVLRPVTWLGDLQTRCDASDEIAGRRKNQPQSAAKWRQVLLQSFIQDPLTCTPFGSQLYQTGAQNLLRLLRVHSELNSDVTEISRDARAPLARIVATLPQSSREAVGHRTLLRTCQQVGELICEAALPQKDRNAEPLSCATSLNSLGLALIEEVDKVLNNS